MVNENKNYHNNIFLKKVHVKINPIHNIFKWMFLYYKCFFVFGRIYVSERIDDNKTSEWKECDSCIFLIMTLDLNQMSAIDVMTY